MATKETTEKEVATKAKKTTPRRTSSAKSKANQCHVIQVEGDLGIAQAEALHRKFCDALENHGKVMIDAGGLARVDASTVQLMHAFIRDAEKNDISVQWKSVPEALQQTADMMGMANGMGFDA